MAVPKKDQERITYARMYGSQACKDGKERQVPDFWREYADAWLQGFNNVQMVGAGKRRASAGEPEAEMDEQAVIKSPIT
ncbi:hypothetical protein NKI59_30880 [Mesorhizobium sp. M0598]|uniref:hypothetical protein n=1 Tax=Mesorhizobium sp. M0598 TaxID=2956968 RepID=UPI00333B0A7A